MSFDILRDTLHTLLCDLPHAGDMQELLTSRSENKCYYYLEASLINQTELPDHVHWRSQANQLMDLLEVKTPSEALTSVYRVLSLLERLNSLSAPERELLAQLDTYSHTNEDSP